MTFHYFKVCSGNSFGIKFQFRGFHMKICLYYFTHEYDFFEKRIRKTHFQNFVITEQISLSILDLEINTVLINIRH